MRLGIHRSVIKNINNGFLDANLGPSATRVAVNSDGSTVYTSCRHQVYQISVPNLNFNKSSSNSSDTTPPSAKPINLPDSQATPHPLHQHTSCVQSVASQSLDDDNNNKSLLVSVDTQGHLLWSSSTNDAANSSTSSSFSAAASKLGGQVTRQNIESVESGWSGVSLGPSQHAAIVQHFDRTLSIADLNSETNTYVGTTKLSGCPTDVGFCGSNTLVATSESNAVVLYDIRQHSSNNIAGSCVPTPTNRQAPSHSILRAVATPNVWPANILTASDDRFVYTIEPRNWRVLRRWRTPLKYEPVRLLRSPSRDSLCYIAGLDNDIMCGDVGGTTQTGGDSNSGAGKKRKREFTQLQMMFSTGFRGDGPWSGVTIRQDGQGKDTNDILYAVSQSCGLYVVKGATGLLEVREG